MPVDHAEFYTSIAPDSPREVQDDAVTEEVTEGIADKSAMSPDGEKPDDDKREMDGDHVDVDVEHVPEKTCHCMVCESGMSAPGRHNIECE